MKLKNINYINKSHKFKKKLDLESEWLASSSILLDQAFGRLVEFDLSFIVLQNPISIDEGGYSSKATIGTYWGTN